jgi:hypothetical protein
MDYVARIYQNKALELQEQVNMLEAMLKDLQEAAPTAPKYGTEKRQSGSGMGDSDKMVDWTGGTVHDNKAWSQSSGGPAIADSEAGDKEIESRMRNLKKSGLFGAEISDDKQSAEYRELKGEQDRRKAARAAASQPAKTPTPANQSSGGSGTASGVPSGKEVKQTQQTADNTEKTTALPTNVTKTGSGLTDEDGRPISVSPKPTPVAPTTQNNDDGIDPKLYVLGGAAALYGAKKLMDRMGRQRGTSPKPNEAPKATEAPKAKEAPKPNEAPKAKETPKATEAPKVKEAPKATPKVTEPVVEPGSYSTPEGKVVTPKKGAPSVAERSAMGRDALRARMAQKTGIPMSFEGPGQAQTPAAAEAPKMTGGEVKPKVTKAATGVDVAPSSTAGKATAEAGAKAGMGWGAKAVQFGKSLAIDTPSMVVGGELAQTGAETIGAGKTDAQVANLAGSIAAPIAMGALGLASLPVAVATAVGYGVGKAVDYGVEKSGMGDVTRREQIRQAMANNAESRKGFKSAEDKVWNPNEGKYMTASETADALKERSKKERASDAEKTFASPEEAAEHFKNMKNPEYRRKHEQEMHNAYLRGIEKEEGGSAYSARVADAVMPDWLANTGEAMGTAWDSFWGTKKEAKGSARGMSYETASEREARAKKEAREAASDE